MTETFRTDAILNQEYHRLFRVIPGTNIHSVSYQDDPAVGSAQWGSHRNIQMKLNLYISLFMIF